MSAATKIKADKALVARAESLLDTSKCGRKLWSLISVYQDSVELCKRSEAGLRNFVREHELKQQGHEQMEFSFSKADKKVDGKNPVE